MSLSLFNPALQRWFRRCYPQATEIQQLAWPVIARGEHCLISAGTGQGKSLAALLPLLDRLLDAAGPLGGRVLYISPLRALSNNQGDGLQQQLAGLAELADQESELRPLSVAVRTGDTSPAERRRQLKSPPDILLTTPESLFVLLGSVAGRQLLSGIASVVVDEVHALISSKRGAHLSLSLERLAALRWPENLQRIGLSATARPVAVVGGFLAGAGRPCRVISARSGQLPDVRVELGEALLGSFAHGEHWRFVVERLVERVSEPGKSLIFCNSRALVERVAAALAERLGEDSVAAHHGSLALTQRQGVEASLRAGQLRVVVCSASLELGIDIGPLARVCQIGAVGSINQIRQRAGRSGHRPGARARLYLFPLTLSDLLDAQALIDALALGRVEPQQLPKAPDDVLAQHLVAMAATEPLELGSALALIRRAWPWRSLDPAQLDAVVTMLHEGFVPGREAGRGPLVRLGGQRLQAGEDARRLALMNPGTIPEWFDYEVIDSRSGRALGRLDEEFAFESSPGQLIQLGARSYRIDRIVSGRVEVSASNGENAQMPFWLGEGRGRSAALSHGIRQIFEAAEQDRWPPEPQLRAFLETARAQLGCLPGPGRLVLERFPDPGGDEHLVLHAFHGQRINRAWGLALRKRFCRQFNFELQASATDNAVLISLGATHSFDLAEVTGFLNASGLRNVLVQAVLDTPLFATRLRWCASTALAIARRDQRGRVPAQLQRNQAENLIARIFPDQLACLENLAGPRQIPDHPLVHQALYDCLQDHMDVEGLIRLYQALEQGAIQVVCKDTGSPSVLAQAAIDAPRHAFLDPAAAEERRTRSFETARPAPRCNPAQLPSVLLRTEQDLERYLLTHAYLPAAEGERNGALQAFRKLKRKGMVFALNRPGRQAVWVHESMLAAWLAVASDAHLHPMLPAILRPEPMADRDDALCRLVLGGVRRSGALSSEELAAEIGVAAASIEAALLRLRSEGLLARTAGEGGAECWTERLPGWPTAAQGLVQTT